jgi:hypothetical protein
MAKATGTTRKVQAAQIKNDEVLAAVTHLTLDKVTGDITQTQVEVQQTLADLSGRITEQLQVLQNIEAAISLKKETLKQLYDIEAKTVELDELVATINTQRQQWAEEQAKKVKEFAEAQAEREKERKRNEAEYQYELSIKHRQQEDAFRTKMETQEKANRDKQEVLEKDWLAREAELKKRETEVAELRQKVAEMPELIRKAEGAASQIAGNSVKKEYETKMQLAAKDAELATRLASQENAALKAQITDLVSQIAGLKTQLDQAQRDVKEISAKALESASGRSAMEAMQKVLLEKEQPTKASK